MTVSYDVLGMGNAIVDVLASTDDEFLRLNKLAKGAMSLIDAERAEALYQAMRGAVECSGGSCGNTMAGIASLGGKAAYIGKVRDDGLGWTFRHDIRAAGVAFDTPAATSGPPTARSLIFVTPDAQRTMNTYLGACVTLSPADVDPALVASAAVTYVEGYLWDAPDAKAAVVKAMDAAHAAGRQVSLTLSDSFCVDRWRDEFLDLVRNKVDILFANEGELLSLYQAKSFDDALQAARRDGQVLALTRSAKGSVVVRGEEVHVVDAAPVKKVVDTTGAGDLYAAGFLYGFTRGLPLAECARIGGIAAAEIISHVGARPEKPLKTLI
ncbi:adenosine kinase [Reyranella sp. CPCC 100927]|uniref:adenosine kinase n=1 Tax=Reyranella sp. CPCC 100927 TaxID=2599616 RepID=UPI0011B67E73|nr:adenosine kinase [Reyranella sp. CPCC 100927]TWS96596.1 adenosine kinase [Reyranella sp. CPCC 100927]